MNTSSRMESTSRPGCIQVSESTYAMLDEDQQSLFEATGGVEVKGKGLMPTYIWENVVCDVQDLLTLPQVLPKKPEISAISFEELRTLRKKEKADDTGVVITKKKGQSSRLHQGPCTRADLNPISMAAMGVKVGDDENDDDPFANLIQSSNLDNGPWGSVANRLNAITGARKHPSSPHQGPQSMISPLAVARDTDPQSTAAPGFKNVLLSAARSQFAEKRSGTGLMPSSEVPRHSSGRRGSVGHGPNVRPSTIMALGQHIRDVALMERQQLERYQVLRKSTPITSITSSDGI